MTLIKCTCGNTILEGHGCTECWKSLTVYRTNELCLSDNWERDRGVKGKCKICWSGVPSPRRSYCCNLCKAVGNTYHVIRHRHKKKVDKS